MHALDAPDRIGAYRVQSELALTWMLMGRLGEAEPAMRAATAMMGRVPDASELTLVQARLADLLVQVGKYDEVLALAETVRAADRKARAAYAAGAEAAALAAMGRRAEAEALRAQLLPEELMPFILDRIALTRILALYALWATPPDVEAMRAEAEQRFGGLSRQQHLTSGLTG